MFDAKKRSRAIELLMHPFLKFTEPLKPIMKINYRSMKFMEKFLYKKFVFNFSNESNNLNVNLWQELDCLYSEKFTTRDQVPFLLSKMHSKNKKNF